MLNCSSFIERKSDLQSYMTCSPTLKRGAVFLAVITSTALAALALLTLLSLHGHLPASLSSLSALHMLGNGGASALLIGSVIISVTSLVFGFRNSTEQQTAPTSSHSIHSMEMKGISDNTHPTTQPSSNKKTEKSLEKLPRPQLTKRGTHFFRAKQFPHFNKITAKDLLLQQGKGGFYYIVENTADYTLHVRLRGKLFIHIIPKNGNAFQALETFLLSYESSICEDSTFRINFLLAEPDSLDLPNETNSIYYIWEDAKRKILMMRAEGSGWNYECIEFQKPSQMDDYEKEIALLAKSGIVDVTYRVNFLSVFPSLFIIPQEATGIFTIYEQGTTKSIFGRSQEDRWNLQAYTFDKEIEQEAFTKKLTELFNYFDVTDQARFLVLDPACFNISEQAKGIYNIIEKEKLTILQIKSKDFGWIAAVSTFEKTSEGETALQKKIKELSGYIDVTALL